MKNKPPPSLQLPSPLPALANSRKISSQNKLPVRSSVRLTTLNRLIFFLAVAAALGLLHLQFHRNHIQSVCVCAFGMEWTTNK